MLCNPVKPCTRLRQRLVFTADPTGIATPLEFLENEPVVDFASARLIASGIIGNLHMRDPILEAPEIRNQMSLHDLHVIKIILNVEIVRTNPIEDAFGMVGGRQEKSWN